MEYRCEPKNLRGLLSQGSARVQMQIFIEQLRLRGETWHWNGNRGALKCDEFCNRKIDKRRILFSTDFVERLGYAFIILRSWMVTIIVDFSVNQAKTQSDLFLFCWLCCGTYVCSRISSSDFSISNLSWYQLVPKS